MYLELSQCLLDMSLWRPLAGREGRTVFCAKVDQALAGLETSQRFAAGEGSQRPAQTHHGGRVVLSWRGETGDERKGQSMHVGLKVACGVSEPSPVHQAPPFCFPSIFWESESRLTSTDSSSVLGKLLLQSTRGRVRMTQDRKKVSS